MSAPLSTIDIECPTGTGLTGVLRRLRLKELDLLASQKNQRKGNALEQMLRSAWSSTTDTGLYRPPYCEWPQGSGGPVPDWMQVLVADRTWILLALRKMSRGSKFRFQVHCEAVNCRRAIPWTIDLDTITVSELSEEARAGLSKGENLFYRQLPFSGAQVGFKLLTGADERTALKARTEGGKDAPFSSDMLIRLPYIEGASSPIERLKFCEEMDAEDAEYLHEQWEEADAIVDSAVEIECPHCDRVQVRDIPFDSDFFWRRSSRKRKR